MSHKTLNQLPPETVKLIASTQIITSVSTAVKELFENALDAEARNIQVKLDNYGFDVLEVKDDGHGISYNNIQRMFLPGYTSKITCFSDLGKLHTYGFRGEALSALAKLSKISVTTKTSADTLAMTYSISNDGIVESSKPSHLTKGTIVTASNIFSKLPVRKQYLSSKKKAAEELKKVEYIVQSLSLIHPELRVTLIHNKCPIWQKNFVKGFKQSFMQVVGLRTVSKLENLDELQNDMYVELLVPKKKLENVDNIFTSNNQSVFLYVNKRPVMLNKISKIVMEHIFHHYAHLDLTQKYAVCMISVEVPPQEIDVNLEPNKTKIYLKNEAEVIKLIDQMLNSYYEQSISRPELEREKTVEDIIEEFEQDDEDAEEILRKRPRIEGQFSSTVGVLRDNEFLAKNDGWKLEVVSISDKKDTSLSLCSQINMENCTLTSREEVGEMKKQLNDNSKLLVTSVNVNSQSRLVDRNELQNFERLKSAQTAEDAPSVPRNEGRILPPWPKRQIPEPRAVTKSSEEEKVENVVKTVDEAAAPTLNDLDFLDNIDLSDWSKGTVKMGDDILPGGVTLARANLITNDVAEEDVDQFDLSMRSVSSQMGKKELSAFTKFARIMRPKILNEYPGMVFTKVAGMLADRWKVLPTDERKYYEKLAKTVDLRREMHMENRTLDEFKTKPPPSRKKPKKSDEKPERYELKITCSFDSITQKWASDCETNSKEDIKLLGQLQPSGNWLYKKGNVIGHLRHTGLHELILSQKMLSSHSVPREPAPRAILINEDILGREFWDCLIRLETEYDPVTCRYTIVSDVITKNGFKIDLEKHEDVFGSGWITEVASMIPFYGIAELRETLNLYRAEGEFADLKRLRSTAVINYITNEVIRIVQQTPRPPDPADINEMMDTWQTCLSQVPAQCLHFRDIFAPIYQLSDSNS